MLKSKSVWRRTARTALLLLGATCLVYAGKDLLPVSVWAGDALQRGNHILTKEYECLCFASIPFQGAESFYARLQDAREEALEAYRAFERAHPEVFWLSPRVKLRYLWQNQNGQRSVLLCYTIWDNSGFSARIPIFQSVREINDIAALLQTQADLLLRNIPKGNRAQQVKAIHGWLTHNNEYNTSPDLKGIGTLPHAALTALTGSCGETGPVCGGYAKALQLLCLRAGIPARQEVGTCVCPGTGETTYHMWNSVQLEDGRWYGVDATWDDPASPGASGAISGSESEDWLLVSEDQLVCGMRFADSHPADPAPGRLWTQEQRRQNDDLMARFAELAKDAVCPF